MDHEMDHGMDDPVLRSLSADLERDDPELAALLTGPAPSGPAPSGPAPTGRASGPPPPPAHPHTALWLALAVPLLALPLLAAALLLPPRVTLGVGAMLFILASPLAVCWLCAAADRADPEPPPQL